MCVIFFYVNSNPQENGYKLILASNRDEFYARPTKEASGWEEAEHVFGGIDMEPGREGGTWLAISAKDGIFKVAALLNLTGEPKPRNAEVSNNLQHHNNEHNNSKHSSILLNNTTNGDTLCTATRTDPIDLQHLTSTTTSLLPLLHHHNNLLLGRGMLVSDYVRNFSKEFNTENYNRQLVNDCSKYSAFNFVSIEIGPSSTPASVTLCSNVPAGLVHYKENTCYGFGNSLPLVPFEKVRYGRNRFENIVENFHKHQEPHQNELVDQLMDLLKCKEKFWPDVELKRRAPNWGEYLSALNVYVPDNGYGSRTHTVILVDAKNKMHFIEETMQTQDAQGKWSRNHIEKQY